MNREQIEGEVRDAVALACSATSPQEIEEQVVRIMALVGVELDD